jgi:hypothetical protein
VNLASRTDLDALDPALEQDAAVPAADARLDRVEQRVRSALEVAELSWKMLLRERATRLMRVPSQRAERLCVYS